MSTFVRFHWFYKEKNKSNETIFTCFTVMAGWLAGCVWIKVKLETTFFLAERN